MTKQLSSKRAWHFSTYETIWLITLTVLAVVVAVLYPEDDFVFKNKAGEVLFSCNKYIPSVFGLLIVVIGNFCELLFSKQIRWAFIIYNLVEVLSVAYYFMVARYPSMFAALIYWIPAHTLGFVFWNRHKDREDQQKTVVRRLKWWHTLLIFTITIVASFGIGYFTKEVAPMPETYNSELVWNLVCYLDASLFVMGIIDGILMFFRSKDSWWTWYLYIFIEAVVIILSQDWVLLVYSFGYLTNSTYGLIKWSDYIKKNEASETPSK